MILKHNGFHYGDRLALWDPRTDMTIVCADEIKSAEKETGIDGLLDKVLDHEMSHRSFYNMVAIKDITIVSGMICAALNMTEKDIVGSNWSIMVNAFRIFNMIRDMDPMLNAFHAFELYAIYRKHEERTKHRMINEQKFFDTIYAQIPDEKSEEIFNNFKWFFDNFPEDRTSNIFFVTACSMMNGLIPMMVSNPKEKSFQFPGEVCNILCDALKRLYQTNKDVSQKTFEDVRKYINQDPSREKGKPFEELDKEIKKQNPKNIGLFSEQYKVSMKVDREEWYNNLRLLLGDDFLTMDSMQLLKQDSSLILVNEDGKNKLLLRKDCEKRQSDLVTNLIHVHALDCLITGLKPECFFCENNVDAYHDTKVHSDLKIMDKNFKDVLAWDRGDYKET